MPPVSMTENVLPFHVALPYRRSLVTPGRSSTIANRCPMILLKTVDLPTLGLPTMATVASAMRHHAPTPLP